MLKLLKNITFFAVILIFISLFSSCKKDTRSQIGGDLQPGNEFITSKYVDSLSCLDIFAYSCHEIDSVISNTTSALWLGSIYNSDFGKVTADIITQILPAKSEGFADSTYANAYNLVDSVVMHLEIYAMYPKRDNNPSPITLNIGELTEAKLIDNNSLSAVYYSNQDVGHTSATVLSNYTFTPTFLDSVFNASDSSYYSDLVTSIPLSNTFGRKILKAAIENYAQLNDFLTEFKGLYFEALPESSPNSGQLTKFNLANSEIVVYHRLNASDAEKTVTSFRLFFNGSMAYNRYHFDRTDANPDFVAQMDKTDTTLGQKTLFLQGFGGSQIKLEMPNIVELKSALGGDSNIIVINNADLVLKVDTLANPDFNPTSQLIISIHRGDTLNALFDQSAYIGGYYNSAKGEYRFNITRHIAHILLTNGEIGNPSLYISDYNYSSQPSCVRLFGPDKEANQEKRMHLEVLYSIIPKQN